MVSAIQVEVMEKHLNTQIRYIYYYQNKSQSMIEENIRNGLQFQLPKE